MIKWQKYLLICVIIFSSIHLIRDVLQHFDIKIFLTEVLNKKNTSNTPVWFWTLFNSFYLEISSILFAGWALYKKSFKPFGFVAVFVLFIFFIAWIIYWFIF